MCKINTVNIFLLFFACTSAQKYLEDAFGLSTNCSECTVCNQVPSPVVSPARPTHRWLQAQTLFAYGDLYPLVMKGAWKVIRELFNQSVFGRIVGGNLLAKDDTSVAAIRRKYGEFATYRHLYTAYMLCDILAHADAAHKTFNASHRFPLLMVDEVGPDEPVIASRRSVNPGHEYAVILPWPHHVFYARKGLNDAVHFALKRPIVVFRGALSGPLHHVRNAHNGMTKSSRYDIVMKWRSAEWADLGISHVPDRRRAEVNQFNFTLAKSLSISEQLQSRYILCVEGADISTAFGWALASYSVPVHPYPFLHHTWYFNGIQPWRHFIPILPDASDLQTVFEWCERNLGECAKIARAGRRHMQYMLRADHLSAVKREILKLWDLT